MAVEGAPHFGQVIACAPGLERASADRACSAYHALVGFADVQLEYRQPAHENARARACAGMHMAIDCLNRSRIVNVLSDEGDIHERMAGITGEVRCVELGDQRWIIVGVLICEEILCLPLPSSGRHRVRPRRATVPVRSTTSSGQSWSGDLVVLGRVRSDSSRHPVDRHRLPAAPYRKGRWRAGPSHLLVPRNHVIFTSSTTRRRSTRMCSGTERHVLPSVDD